MNSLHRWLGTVFGALLACAVAHGQNRGEAEALKQRFIAHLNANMPIAGEFEVHGSSDPDFHKKRLDKLKDANERLKKIGGKVGIESAERLLVCRWAIDRDREMMETLPESRNTYKTFLSVGDVLLEGFEGNGKNRSFNISKNAAVTFSRPANFYFLVGMGHMTTSLPRSWDAKSIESAPAGAPAGTVVLVLTDKKIKGELRLLVERETCILHSMDQLFDSKPFRQLTIQEYARGPNHRVFPTKARLVLYSPTESKLPVGSETLVARRVTFPTSNEEIAAAFHLDIPNKSIVADRILNHATVLKDRTPAEKLMNQPLPSPMPMTQGTDFTPYMEPKSNRMWYWIGGSVCVVLAAMLIVWQYLRWKRGVGAR